jgi:XTP/dITP diphosphohydrolase
VKQLLIASTNRGKLKEIQAILNGLPVELLMPEDLDIHLDVEEIGQTYAENAALKALAYCSASGLITLADDSGLEVDALDGAPGLYSARFSPKPNAQDADRRAYLLEKLQGLPRPWPARFHCTVAIATPSGEMFHAEGICPGEILDHEAGTNGFGYDPLFFLPQFNCTMAELSSEEKNKISHRARALQAALPILKRLIESPA